MMIDSEHHDVNEGAGRTDFRVVEMSRRQEFLAMAIAAALGFAVLHHALGLIHAAKNPPRALWRDGVIVQIRNCDAPHDEDALLTCAGLHCAQRVTEQIEYPFRTKVRVDRTYLMDSGEIWVGGSIDPWPRAPDKPNAFSCTMTDHRRASPELAVRTRAPTLPHERR